jgi:hypothetical protein
MVEVAADILIVTQPVITIQGMAETVFLVDLHQVYTTLLDRRITVRSERAAQDLISITTALTTMTEDLTVKAAFA